MGRGGIHKGNVLAIKKKVFVRSGIRTHAHRSGLRPERSALDRSAILTGAPDAERYHIYISN